MNIKMHSKRTCIGAMNLGLTLVVQPIACRLVSNT